MGKSETNLLYILAPIIGAVVIMNVYKIVWDFGGILYFSCFVIGIIALFVSKFRIIRSGDWQSFGYGKMTSSEKKIYLAGYVLILLGIAIAIFISKRA